MNHGARLSAGLNLQLAALFQRSLAFGKKRQLLSGSSQQRSDQQGGLFRGPADAYIKCLCANTFLALFRTVLPAGLASVQREALFDWGFQVIIALDLNFSWDPVFAGDNSLVYVRAPATIIELIMNLPASIGVAG